SEEKTSQIRSRAQSLLAEQDRVAPVRYFLQHRARPVELHPCLIDVVEEHLLSDFYRSFVGPPFAQTNAQQCGLADAIAADDACALGRFEGEREPPKKPPLPVAFADRR